MIPSIIHGIWLQGFDKLPAKYSSNVQSVIDLNPGWTYMKWDDKSIREALATIGPAYVAKYDSFSLLHQKVDFGRYAVLYLYGGVSVDIDAKALKGFSSLPGIGSSDFIVSKNSSGQFINNATILVSAKNPLMLSLLDSVSGSCSSFITKTGCVYSTTGPGAFTKFVKVHSSSITVLPSSYFEPCSGRDPYCEVGPDTILDHRHEGTWVHPLFDSVSKLGFTVRRYQSMILFLIIILVFIILINKK